MSYYLFKINLLGENNVNKEQVFSLQFDGNPEIQKTDTILPYFACLHVFTYSLQTDYLHFQDEIRLGNYIGVGTDGRYFGSNSEYRLFRRLFATSQAQKDSKQQLHPIWQKDYPSTTD